MTAHVRGDTSRGQQEPGSHRFPANARALRAPGPAVIRLRLPSKHDFGDAAPTPTFARRVGWRGAAAAGGVAAGGDSTGVAGENVILSEELVLHNRWRISSAPNAPNHAR